MHLDIVSILFTCCISDVYCRMKSRCLIPLEEYLSEEDLNVPRRVLWSYVEVSAFKQLSKEHSVMSLRICQLGEKGKMLLISTHCRYSTRELLYYLLNWHPLRDTVHNLFSLVTLAETLLKAITAASTNEMLQFCMLLNVHTGVGTYGRNSLTLKTAVTTSY